MSDDSEQKYRKVSTKTTVHHYHPGASDPFDVAYKAEAENMRDRYWKLNEQNDQLLETIRELRDENEKLERVVFGLTSLTEKLRKELEQ